MNYRALLLSLLILLPLGLIVAPRVANSMQIVQPALSVYPPWSNFTGPCAKSTEFTIDVRLFNNPMSGVDVYAFDFYLDWFGEVSLVSAHYTSPWANYFEIANETSGMTYHLALTAVPPSEGIIDIWAPVLTLTFHIDVDICWNDEIIRYFELHDVKMVADGGVVIPITQIEVDNGGFKLTSVQPNIELTSTAAAASTDGSGLPEIIGKCNSTTFDVEVDLTNVTAVYDFFVYIVYDPAYLETDIQKITFKSAFPPPYEYLQVIVGDPLPAGTIGISLVRPCEKPAVCGEVVPAVDIIFHTAHNHDDLIPVGFNSTISIVNAGVSSKCNGIDRYYSYPGDVLYGGDLKYAFMPSACDLNLDCVVDVQDLKVLVPFYGTVTVVGGYGDLFDDVANPQLVDIYDFVKIAKCFGPVDP